ncbi:hypothetical protein HRR95_003130 [Exophiala dermatitidis]|nr:hypothetical protein HRR95_003130 [Exophiala dermatitidis]
MANHADNGRRISPSDFYEIMDMLDKRLNDKGKNWRHVLKSLKVLDYCLHEGSELVVTWARKNIYIIKTLREFQYVDEDGRDVGQNVRTTAKELTSLILDEDRLRSERSDRKLWKARVSGLDEYAPQAIAGPSQRPRRQTRSGADDDDPELRRALELSKMEADQEARDRSRHTASENDEQDPELRRAIQLSKEEADLRARQLEDQNAASLFDDTPVPAQSQPTGFNQGYQQQPAVDWFGNPLQQQPQSTGFLSNQYAQPQQTGFQPGYTGAFQSSQPTGYDQFGQQPFLQQQNTLQPQQTAFPTNNPYGMQTGTDLFGAQSPQQAGLQPGTNNPFSASSPQPLDAMKPLPTGSNNPFAQRTQQASPSPFARATSQPALGTLFESQPTSQFSQPTQPNPILNYSSPQPSFQQQQQAQKPVNPQHAKLNALLASGEGQDTFGNTGDLRIPAQHTAPGTFVNSAGQGLDRLRAAQTGTNPFFSAQATGFAQNQPGFGQQAPAQTGPAGGFGGFTQQNNNPFGQRPGAQQSGSLIDL